MCELCHTRPAQHRQHHRGAHPQLRRVNQASGRWPRRADPRLRCHDGTSARSQAAAKLPRAGGAASRFRSDPSSSHASNRGSRAVQRPEGLFTRPELWVGAAVVLTMLLVEVWQSSHMAQLCLTLEQTRSALGRQRGTDVLPAGRRSNISTAPMTPLRPAGPHRRGASKSGSCRPSTLRRPHAIAGGDFRLAARARERVSGALVPEATARGRVTR